MSAPRYKNLDPKLPVRPSGTRAPRPRDAATIIIYRRGGGTIEVLMGERHSAHKFMPQRYVFPGGRVDPSDSRVRLARPLRTDVAERLGRAATAGRARALAAAAIRETYEETGLLIGAPDPSPGRPVPEPWRLFFAAGIAPALDRLDYIARAVTPPVRPIRFNARFFMIEADGVEGEIGGSGELLNLHWVAVAETTRLDLPRITAKVLELAAEVATLSPAAKVRRPVILFINTPDGHVTKEE